MPSQVQFGFYLQSLIKMTFQEIQTQFDLCKSWEERYRLLIQLSRTLPKPTDEELANLPEIHGCESRLWFLFQVNPRQIQAYSDARLMQGLLAIIIALLDDMTDEERLKLDLQAVFDQLKITKNLTSTRLNGLKQIESRLKNGS